MARAVTRLWLLSTLRQAGKHEFWLHRRLLPGLLREPCTGLVSGHRLAAVATERNREGARAALLRPSSFRRGLLAVLLVVGRGPCMTRPPRRSSSGPARRSPRSSTAGTWSSRAWSRCRCGGRTASHPGHGSWTGSGSSAAWPAKAHDRGRSQPSARTRVHRAERTGVPAPATRSPLPAKTPREPARSARPWKAVQVKRGSPNRNAR